MLRLSRFVSLALLAALLAIGQVGFLTHALTHRIDRAAELAALHEDHAHADAHHDHDHGGLPGDTEPCNAFDGLIGACALGKSVALAPVRQAIEPAQAPATHRGELILAYASRGPPAAL